MGSKTAERGHLVRDLTRGTLAGVAATWAMGQVTTLMYEKEDPRARREEDEVRGGKTAYGVAAEKIALVAGKELSDTERAKMGARLHWLLGIAAGAKYGALRTRLPALGWGRGLAFGFAFFLVVDEGVNAVFGLTPGPLAFPWQAHARGLVGHLVFGAVADSVLDLME